MDHGECDRRRRRGVRHGLTDRPAGAAAVVALAAAAGILLMGAAAGAESGRIVYAVSEVTGPEGSRPYEMEWAGRVEDDRPPLVDFEDLRGWTVHCDTGVAATLQRSREQKLFGETTARLAYRLDSGTSGALRIRPPSPVSVPGPFDSVTLWVYGNNWEWAPDPGTPPVDVSVILLDWQGVEVEISLTRVRWKEWWLAHRRLSAEQQERLRGGSLAGLAVRGISNREDRFLFLDNLAFFREELAPLSFEPRPRRGVDPFPGQSPGLNTGPGRLPFPTREETILPMQFATGWENSIEQKGDSFLFRYRGPDAFIEYEWRPAEGGPETIVARLSGETIRPLAGCRVVFEEQPPLHPVKSARVGDSVRAVYRCGDQQVEWTAHIWQKSLVLDCISQGGRALGLDLGRFEGVRGARAIQTPFITFGAGNNPAVLMGRSGRGAWFGSVWLDWYRSNASELHGAPSLEGDGIRINGGSRYHPKTDGRRNDVFERIFLTLSPVFEEVYPTIANPPSPAVREAGKYLWQESWGPHDYAAQMERSRRLASYGITRLIQCNHEDTWRDGGESFTLRLRSAPGKGGDEALKAYLEHQKSLGWRVGLYTNYTDLACVNEHWHPDLVQRTSDGQWRPGWPRNYALKPSRAVELDARLAPQIQSKFGTDAAYTDVHTAASPWQYTDYDARVPGAGTFAATFYAYGELLLNDQRVYGIAHSEGTYQWLYAGLATGNYALCYGGLDPAHEPLNVAFSLYQIHPREADIGMAWESYFLRSFPGWDSPEKIDASIDHFLAATLAYGHIGWLVMETSGIERTCRSYYMLLPVTERYSGLTPERVVYADACGRLRSASEAWAEGFISLSRLCVRYPGLELRVNGGEETWEIPSPDGRLPLPQWGWAAWSADGAMFQFSGLHEGRRIDYCRSVDYEYLDGRGALTQIGALACAGGAVRRGNEILDIYGNEQIGFRAGAGGGRMEVFGPGGERVSEVAVRRGRNGWLWFRTVPGGRRYRFIPDSTVSALQVSGPEEAAPGEAVRIELEDRGRTVRRVLTVPFDAVPGERVWLDVGGAEVDFRVVPALQIRSGSPGKLPGGGLRIPVTVYCRCQGDGPQVEFLEQEGVDACLTGFAQKGRRLNGVLQVHPLPSHGGEAFLTISARCGDREERLRLEFELLEQRRTDLLLVGQGTPWRWGTLERGGAIRWSDSASGACWHVDGVPVGGVLRMAIFSHPPYVGRIGSVFGETELIESAEDLEFSCLAGIRDGGGPSDGVTFSVWRIEDGSKPALLAERHVGQGRWEQITVLVPHSGRAFRLRLQADCGPADNPDSDWAAWADIRLRSVDASPVLRLR